MLALTFLLSARMVVADIPIQDYLVTDEIDDFVLINKTADSLVIDETDFALRQQNIETFSKVFDLLDGDFSDIALMANVENLAHVPYQFAKHKFNGFDGLTTSHIYDADGKIREYLVYPIEVANKGLLPYVLVGAELDNHRVHIVFRGTNFREKASLARNLDFEGAGHGTFYGNSGSCEQVLGSVMALIMERGSLLQGQKIDVTVAGHSLGGADAQMFTLLLLEELFKQYIENSLQPVGLVHVMLKNATGVNESLYKKSIKLAKNLKSKMNIDLALSAILVAGDGIQKTGEATIWSSTEAPVSLTLFKVLAPAFVNRSIAQALVLSGLFISPQSSLAFFPFALYGLQEGAELKKNHSYRFFQVEHDWKDGKGPLDYLEIYKGDRAKSEKEIICKKLSNKSSMVKKGLSFFKSLSQFFDPVTSCFGSKGVPTHE